MGGGGDGRRLMYEVREWGWKQQKMNQINMCSYIR